MKKSFLTLAMVLLGLFVGVNTMWAINISGMTPAEAETQGFWARLIAKPAATTTGSGLVFVSDVSDEPDAGDYESVSSSKDGFSDIFLASSLIDADVEFYVFAKANPGSYFTGWSYTEGYTDLGTGGGNYLHTKVTPSSTKGHTNVREHTIYAAFESVKLVSYEFISGSNTTAKVGDDWTCTQTVKFRAETPDVWALSSGDDTKHFKRPVVTKKAGTNGTWSIGDAAWIASGVGQNFTAYGEYAELSVPVTFVAPNGDPGEYAAELVLETYAGVKMKVYLYARTTGAGGEAIRYNSSKVQQEAGNLVTLLNNAVAGDIIKLNGDYSNAVEINKNITFDLNGYTLNNTLTISGGNVTLAYSPYGGSVNAMTVTGGKATLTGGTIGQLTISSGAVVEQNGATITTALNNNGTLTTTDGSVNGALTSSGTLTVNGGTFSNISGEAITISGGSATIKRGTITGSTYGVKTTGGTTTIEKLAAVTGATKALSGAGGTLTVNNGKFTDPENLIDGSVTFNAGFFRTNTAGTATALGKQVWRNTAGVEYREGYEFFVGSQDAAQASNVSVCRIAQTAYSSLEDALAYANNNPTKAVLIFMENDYVLNAGYYTIPANATLIIPMADDQDVAYPVVPRETGAYVTPHAFRTLTFVDGVNMNVQGTIELSCGQYKNGTAEQSLPGGPYGHLILKPGSHITINNGGEIRAWGYVTGDGTKDATGKYLSGEIDARRGSIVREQFQMGDWKGGDISFTMILDQAPQNMTHLFPVYMYFIQNVESPVKYHPGSSLICATSVVVSGSISAYADDIKVVGKNGEPAMFLMDEMADAENTWVRKWYDAQHDKQVYEVNSGAQLGSMVIDLGEVPASMIKPGTPGMFNIQLDSRKFVLPLTSNFKIHLLTGNMQFTQSTSCLPGMEVEIDKESEISIINLDRADVVEGALYLYDADQWCFMNNPSLGGYVGLNKGKFGAIVHYSATWDLDPSKTTTRPNVRDISSPSAIGDAVLNVHGTFRTGENCSVYTTWSKGTGDTLEDNPFVLNTTTGTGGASIISTNEDAGTFIFDADAPTAFQGVTWDDPANFGQLEHLTGIGPDVLVNFDNNNYGSSSYPIAIGTALHPDANTRMFGWELCTPAKLKNGTGAEHPFAETQSVVAGKSYCYINNQWTLMDVDEDDECFMVDNYGTFYAKPADYVAVVATKDGEGKITGNDDHTFSDKAGTGRLFILMKDDCQWWEVEKKDNLYHCIHPNNDTYYYWDDSNANPNKHKWVEKKFTITWKNWDGTIIQTTNEDGDLVDNYDVTYGTMAEFLGNNPTREANIDYTYDFTGWSPELGPVKSDVTYTATYVEQPRKYTIIFLQEGGTEIERHFLTHNEIPVCENVPTRTGCTLEWSPAIAAVTGDATYTATWLEEPPTEYEITFFDYNGTTILQQGNVAVGTVPTPPANPSNKPETSEFTYVFDHWSPALEEVSVTSAKSYTAVYSEVAKTYTVIFQNEDGSEIERHEYSYGATPVCAAAPTKENTAQYTYSFAWTPQIQTVQGPATYRAVFTPTTNKYTVTLLSNSAAGCSFLGAGIYDYGTNVTIQAIPAADYIFVRWQETGNTDANMGAQTVEGDITYTAIVKEITDGDLDNLVVSATGSETITPGQKVMDLTIISNGAQSGEIINAENLTVRGEANFDLAINAQANTWYAIAVPWQVEVSTGITVGGVRQVANSDFYMAYYDGAIRAAEGKVDACWKYMNSGSIMQPGRLYMLYMTHAASTIRFQKKSLAPLQTKTLSVQAHPQATGSEADAGWNGIANPALFHGYINANANTYSQANWGQKYNPSAENYDAINLTSAENELIVGAPIFVQVAADKNDFSVYDNWSDAAAHAPVRKAMVKDSYYEVHISAGEEYTDRIYLQTLEDKEDTYVIGLDLAKAGLSTKVAQMWVDRYNTLLCVNTTAPVGKTATYPLGIYAPQDGEYQIYPATEMQDNQELYVTREGRAIWNLAYGPYILNLTAGTHTQYGLKLIQREAPATTTGVDELPITDDQSPMNKVIIDNHIYILRDGQVYTITGQKVN